MDRDHRSLFGKSLRAIWLTDSTPPGVLAAAYQQHVVSRAVNEALRESGLTVEEFANSAGLGVETLRRKLRGEVWMSLIDIAILEVAFPEVHAARASADLIP